VELVFAILVGVLYAAGLYLMLRRRLAQLIIGIGLLTNGTNLLIFNAGGLTRARPPVIPPDALAIDGAYADPVPQSLILTAIVIGFGVLAFALLLAHHVLRTSASDDMGA
jgi:multicomponent Na+:H+ antiporter subunit C